MKSMTKFGKIKQGMLVLILGCSASLTAVNLVGGYDTMTQVSLSGPITPAKQQLPHQSQGISGFVFSLNGNQMPINQPDESRSNSQPVSTKVWIFAGKIIGTGSPRWPLEKAQQHPGLIGWTVSDSSGRFKVGLPPGEYTVLAEYGSDLYLNKFLGDGSFASVQVTANQVTEVKLINTENAVF
jgi:hypothetical protein